MCSTCYPASGSPWESQHGGLFSTRLTELNINTHINVNITEIGEDYIEFETEDGIKERILSLTNVIIAAGVESNKEIYEHIKTSRLVKRIINVGDSKKPATMKEAIEDGFKTGRKI